MLQVKLPPEGTRPLLLCLDCRPKANHRAIYLAVRSAGSLQDVPQFAGWQRRVRLAAKRLVAA